jgi:RNA polymerase sigma-70 factor, ECF subfamily
MKMPPPSANRPPHLPQDIERWLRGAREGSAEALGRLLEACRQYLLLVANEQLDAGLRDKVGPSDLVQETFLDAQQDLRQFHGRTEAELLAWLRRILLNNLTDARRRYRAAGKRDVAREVPLADAPREELRHRIAREDDSPRTRLADREQAEALRRALDRLPEASRRVIDWRNYGLCSFAEIGRRLGKSEEAARKAWARAVEQLQRTLEPPA